MSMDRESIENEDLEVKASAVEENETSENEDGEETEQTEVEKASPAARKIEPVVLAHVLGPKYQPVKPRVIAKQLKLPSEQHKALKLCIRRLVKAGKLVYGSGHIVRAPRPAAAERVQGSGFRVQTE